MLCGALLFGTAFIANAQQQPTPTTTPIVTPTVTPSPTASPNVSPTPAVDDPNEIIKVSSKLVVVPASVIDANGQPVMGLTIKDFRLEEEGRPQEVAQISNADEVPLEIVVLFDVSASVGNVFEYEKSAAARFLQGVMKPRDRASVFLISDRAELVQTRDNAEKTAATISKIAPTKNYTEYFVTVAAAVDYLKKNTPENSRRVILSISDGDDTGRAVQNADVLADRELNKKINTLTQSQSVEIRNRYRNQSRDQSQQAILRSLQNADTVFYSVNPSGAIVKINPSAQRGQDGLQRFAADTGGTAFLINVLPETLSSKGQDQLNAKQNETNLENIFRQISAELRAQYLVQYYSDASFPKGTFVRVKVDLPAKNNLRVRARQGYFANSAQ